MATKDDIIRTALELPAEERGEVIQALVTSLEPGTDEEPRHVATAWKREILRRVDELRQGEVETVDAFEAIAQARARLHREPKE